MCKEGKQRKIPCLKFHDARKKIVQAENFPPTLHFLMGSKKIPVVPVSYREKIRVGRSEIIFFLNIFFMVFSIISVTTDAILAAARNHPEKIRSHGQSR
jgi:hypothetical protein